MHTSGIKRTAVITFGAGVIAAHLLSVAAAAPAGKIQAGQDDGAVTVIRPPKKPAPSTAPEAESLPGLLPHLAVYDFSLARAAHRTGMTAGNGRIVFDIQGSPCTKWTSRTRMVIEMTFRRRGSRLTDARDRTEETADGSRMTYESRRFVNGAKVEDIRLKAERDPESGTVRLNFERPDTNTFELPGDTLFPIQATRHLLKAAQAGRRYLTYRVYEGFADGRARKVVAVIGPPMRQDPSVQGVPGLPETGNLPAWPVSLAYYEDKAGRDVGVPRYQVSFRLHANGVLSEILLDYGDYALKGTLVEVRPYPQEKETACKPSGQ